MAYVIASPCVGEKAADCVSVCPVDCIHEGEDQYFIDADTCIDCGACEAECPVSAIYYEDDLPENEQIFKQKAIDFFKNN
ncbi:MULTISPECIES: ferredoxin family protein [unclassified Paenibacillus]|uniref:indolepyruvate ferredoxin oxidoreductase subunit alpha n=1 Tax=unclassified Paenibacillus TaxID=185978 RepID=UPI001C10AC67|nr:MULTISPECIES: ferredoxin family protein [unclassified Paenibacillus]MBU5445525.1 ferredoxin family protein [Paenibacillus sp. MSJ-34]CAH0118901.1 Ferredoxin 7Fe [Paenibacillus sp. CECT 9249]